MLGDSPFTRVPRIQLPLNVVKVPSATLASTLEVTEAFQLADALPRLLPQQAQIIFARYSTVVAFLLSSPYSAEIFAKCCHGFSINILASASLNRLLQELQTLSSGRCRFSDGTIPRISLKALPRGFTHSLTPRPMARYRAYKASTEEYLSSNRKTNTCLLIIFQRGRLCYEQLSVKVNREKGIDVLYRVHGSTTHSLHGISRV